MYQQGVDKFAQEIDVISYTKSLRLLKTLLSSLMDDSEKYLSIYQHQNCLKLFDKGMNEDDAPEDIQIPHLMSNSGTIESHQNQVNRFFRSYMEEKLTAKDFRLLKGVFSNEDLNNNELGMIKYEERKAGDEMSPSNSSLPDHDIQINHIMQDYHKQAKLKVKNRR